MTLQTGKVIGFEQDRGVMLFSMMDGTKAEPPLSSMKNAATIKMVSIQNQGVVTM